MARVPQSMRRSASVTVNREARTAGMAAGATPRQHREARGPAPPSAGSMRKYGTNEPMFSSSQRPRPYCTTGYESARPSRPAKSAERGGLAQDEARDVLREEAQRAEHAVLLRALADAHRHGVAEEHPEDEQDDRR
jgi:hypothetical protein